MWIREAKRSLRSKRVVRSVRDESGGESANESRFQFRTGFRMFGNEVVNDGLNYDSNNNLSPTINVIALGDEGG